MPKFLWKTLKKGLVSDKNNFKWKIGKWYHTEGEIKCCNNGFHGSERIIDAMSYVSCEILALVEVKGENDKESNKQSWSDMRIVKTRKWTKKDSVKLSIFAAELCLKNFEKKFPEDKRPREAIEAAKNWLKNPCGKTLSAAESAAWSAESAAWSAESAAWSAESAAWSAESAARSAWSAARSAESAAWSAESAARSAWSAARSAESAARSAESAARSAESEKVLIKCEKFILKEICNDYFAKK